MYIYIIPSCPLKILNNAYLFQEVHHSRVHLEVREVVVDPEKDHPSHQVAKPVVQLRGLEPAQQAFRNHQGRRQERSERFHT